jgi:hypothetical protein
VAKCLSLDTIRERLTLDDVMTEDKATQAGSRAGSSRATYEPGSSSRRCKYREIDELCLYILEFQLLEYCIIKEFNIHFAYICFFFSFLKLLVIMKFNHLLSLVILIFCMIFLNGTKF